MKQTAMQEHIEWLKSTLEICEEHAKPLINCLNLCIAHAESKLQMAKTEKLKHQLFIGKVSEIIGCRKTIKLLKECNNEIL